jgi:sugar transferase (PEP-CTERM system associated)
MALALKRVAMLRISRHYMPALLFVTVAADLSVIAIALLSAQWIGFPNGEGALWRKLALVAGANLLALSLADLYKLDFRIRRVELLSRLLVALIASMTITAAVGYVLPVLSLGRLAFTYAFGVIALGLLSWRLVWLNLGARRPLRHRVLVLGVGPAASVLPELQFSPTRPFTIVGFLDNAPDAADRVPAGFELLGKTEDLLVLADELRPDLVLVALAEMRRAFPAEELLECRLQGIQVEDWPTFYERQTGKIHVTNLRPSWLIFSDGFVKTDTTRMVKRAMDVGLAFAGLVVSLPFMVLAACAIRLEGKGPILFRQERVGERGRIFVLKKFRSMTVDAERDGPVWAAERDPRVTRVGRWLRRTRLDELPQFWNVLAGDMSFVGPRPERPEFVDKLQREIPFYMGRHSVKPGITGWAQVRQGYAASVEDSMEKLQYDLYYIKNLSLLLDLVILLSTLQVVLFRRGSR